ncbi:TetR family transcriptional regulator [Actinorhabdospora filicis]|uniref:TetR family transcriptional regulator n=1 Tax=Actinorhabdospora filicis TaxID=1785913 RepID=A0A9W6WC14_9ACTN|nr:TetR family transcriptional regulator [Actinorhabdospora filicis]GLZ80618.1 TetR family transcriptional regulator [Actinorhabdospora filicis]
MTTLRERKKQRTRRQLVDTAIELFTAHGFDAVTLDRLVGEVEVSQRTFFRMFASKEDVALDPERHFWRSFAAALREAPLDGPLLGVLEGVLLANIAAMPPEWTVQFRASRRLAEATPALNAKSLRFCADATAEVVTGLAGRTGADPGGLPLRLAVDLMLAAWNAAVHDWPDEDGGLPRLAQDVRAAFAALPAALTLTVT